MSIRTRIEEFLRMTIVENQEMTEAAGFLRGLLDENDALQKQVEELTLKADAYDYTFKRGKEAGDYCDKFCALQAWGRNIWHAVLDDALKMRAWLDEDTPHKSSCEKSTGRRTTEGHDLSPRFILDDQCACTCGRDALVKAKQPEARNITDNQKSITTIHARAEQWLKEGCVEAYANAPQLVRDLLTEVANLQQRVAVMEPWVNHAPECDFVQYPNDAIPCSCGLQAVEFGEVQQPIPPVRFRSEKQLRDVVSMLAHFVWYRTTRPGDHVWSIPVDQERDWDCILTDAIDELIARRTAAGEVQQPIPRYRVMDDRPCSQCGAPLIWDNVCSGADCLFCLHQAFAACTCDEVQQPIPELGCCVPAPDRSGRECNKPKGHDGDHWTYGGHTLTWAQQPIPQPSGDGLTEYERKCRPEPAPVDAERDAEVARLERHAAELVKQIDAAEQVQRTAPQPSGDVSRVLAEMRAEAAERRRWSVVPCQTDQSWHADQFEAWADRLAAALSSSSSLPSDPEKSTP